MQKKGDSIFNNPGFNEWVRNFDVNDPKFLAEVNKRSKTSKACFSGLERQAKRIDRKIDVTQRIPIRSKNRD